MVDPTITPIKTSLCSRSKLETPVIVAYAASKASDVSTADPIAKPFPVAAVVFPKESRASVRSRTFGSIPDISAIPPALSAIGPYASVASVIPRVESMPIAANATP